VSSDANQSNDFDRMLESSRELRARYRDASSEEPPPELDDAIRAHARRAVASRPRAAGSPFLSRWRLPLSLAAMLMLSATLTIMVTRNGRHIPVTDESIARKAAVPRAVPQPVSPTPAQPAPEPQQPSTKQRELSKQMQPADQHQPSAPPSAAATEQPSAHALEKRATPFPAAPSPAMPEAKAPATSGPASNAAEAPAAGVTPLRDHAASKSDAGLADQQDQKSTRGKLESSADTLQRQGKPEQGVNAREEIAGPSSPQSAASPPVAAPPAARAVARAPWENDPREWLRHIESLVRENRSSEARESLKAFRQRYPGYTLPSDFPLREP
jgi:hypothetical protein